ncbi:hypothetical protein ZWY2020_045519, partial [Hordeum vulgare]
WRHATSLLFVFDGPTFPRYKRFEQLVKLVIHLRGNSPLIRCEIDAYPDDEPEDTFTNTRLPIDYALACKAKELLFDVPFHLVSHHLKTIHLEGVKLDHSALKFSGCPVLEMAYNVVLNMPYVQCSKTSDDRWLIANSQICPLLFQIGKQIINRFHYELEKNYGTSFVYLCSSQRLLGVVAKEGYLAPTIRCHGINMIHIIQMNKAPVDDTLLDAGGIMVGAAVEDAC